MNYYQTIESLIIKYSKSEPKLTRLQLQRKVMGDYSKIQPLNNEMYEAVDNDIWEMVANYHSED